MVLAFADVNIALKKPTKLSSIFDPKISQQRDYICCNSSYAVDGDNIFLFPDYPSGDFFCAHSDSLSDQQSWWAVDLQEVYVINDVDIFGRIDCCTHQLANFDVEVFMPTCIDNNWNYLEDGCKINCHYQSTESQRTTVSCPSNTKGRYIRIRRRDTSYLVICEVEVYGNPINNFHKSDLGSTIINHVCRKSGYGYVGPVIGTSVAHSNIQCTSTCTTETACSAAEYDNNTNVCTLKGECLNETQSSLYVDKDKHVLFIR
ncbi:uncharacterized protein [Mytilus edulis]|uniref:uncharacterized protein n=1 Tax=Mytilus edulis TaxID=6550 RepID=UPI0039F1125C